MLSPYDDVRKGAHKRARNWLLYRKMTEFLKGAATLTGGGNAPINDYGNILHTCLFLFASPDAI